MDASLCSEFKEVLSGFASVDQDNYSAAEVVSKIVNECDLKAIDQWLALLATSDPIQTGAVESLSKPLETILA